jgi:hypothetical protein
VQGHAERARGAASGGARSRLGKGACAGSRGEGPRVGEREGKGGREEGEGKLTLGSDDRWQPSTGSHLGQRRWKRGGREGEEVVAREKKIR